MSFRSQLKPHVKRLAYSSRALESYHRVKNRHQLTVVMFHRVIAKADPRWKTCDPEYTISDRLFGNCLEFFDEHYHVVSTDQVLAARAHTAELPERPLLITFDDGWSDNEEFALPYLQRAGMPALMFVVSDAVGRDEPFFQERMVIAWRAGRIGAHEAAQLWAAADGNPDREPNWGSTTDEIGPLRGLIALLEWHTEQRRSQLLAQLGDALEVSERHMVTAEQLNRLLGAGVGIGSHGQTHTPLPRASSPAAELSNSRARLGELTGVPPQTISFPHGRYDEQIVQAAKQAGYELIFTSDRCLNPLLARERGTAVPALLGRIGFTTETVTDERGQFCPELLALALFRPPHKLLEQPG